MPKLPVITGDELIKALQKHGFARVRQKGSHVQVAKVMLNGQKITFPVPVHSGKTLKSGTLRGILRLASVTPEELTELL